MHVRLVRHIDPTGLQDATGGGDRVVEEIQETQISHGCCSRMGIARTGLALGRGAGGQECKNLFATETWIAAQFVDRMETPRTNPNVHHASRLVASIHVLWRCWFVQAESCKRATTKDTIPIEGDSKRKEYRNDKQSTLLPERYIEFLTQKILFIHLHDMKMLQNAYHIQHHPPH